MKKELNLIFLRNFHLAGLGKNQSLKVHSTTNIIFQYFHPIFGLNSQKIQYGKLGKSF